jgi:hypothetical protein
LETGSGAVLRGAERGGFGVADRESHVAQGFSLQLLGEKRTLRSGSFFSSFFALKRDETGPRKD